MNHRERERDLVVRALRRLEAAVAGAGDQQWDVQMTTDVVQTLQGPLPGQTHAAVIAPSIAYGPRTIAPNVRPEHADVIALAVPAARGLIAVLQDVKLIMNAYPTPEAVRGEIARGVRLAKLIVGDA